MTDDSIMKSVLRETRGAVIMVLNVSGREEREETEDTEESGIMNINEENLYDSNTADTPHGPYHQPKND